ncbi:MAG: LUD domain-containing protein [Rheinheimera sp.]|nr:LUD domain-containing protein [Rheinheimera sp.]
MALSLPGCPEFLPAPAMTGWGFSKDFPKPASKPFRARFNSLPAEKAAGLPSQVSAPAARPSPAPAHQPAVPLLRKFIDEANAVGGRLSTFAPEQVSAQVIAFLRERSIERVQMWDNVLAIFQAADLTAAGIRVEQPCSPEISAGITGALAGIAETGSLVIPGGAGMYTTASLVPEIHLAILRASDILPPTRGRHPPARGRLHVFDSAGDRPQRTPILKMTLTVGDAWPQNCTSLLLMTDFMGLLEHLIDEINEKD